MSYCMIPCSNNFWCFHFSFLIGTYIIFWKMNVPVRKNYVQFLKVCWMLIQQVNWARIISSLLNTRMVKNFNTLLPNIRTHILPTIFSTFPKVLTWRIYSFFGWGSFPSFSQLYCLIQGWYCKEKLDASHSWGLKGQCVSRKTKKN